VPSGSFSAARRCVKNWVLPRSVRTFRDDPNTQTQYSRHIGITLTRSHHTGSCFIHTTIFPTKSMHQTLTVLMLIYPSPNKNPYPQIHSRIHAFCRTIIYTDNYTPQIHMWAYEHHNDITGTPKQIQKIKNSFTVFVPLGGSSSTARRFMEETHKLGLYRVSPGGSRVTARRFLEKFQKPDSSSDKTCIAVPNP